MLIRLADLMDVANDRVNYHLLRQNLTHLSLTSKFHWISHLVTDCIELRTMYDIPKKENGELSKKQIMETGNFDLHLNFQQLTTIPNTRICKCRKCLLGEHCITISILSGENHTKRAFKSHAPFCVCGWQKTWVVETRANCFKWISFFVDNSMFKTYVNLYIYYRNDMKLDSDMFDSIQEYLGI